jgi:hypothetical protein
MASEVCSSNAALLGLGSISAAAPRLLTAPPSTAAGYPRGLAAATRALLSVVVGLVVLVVTQAAATTPELQQHPELTLQQEEAGGHLG